MKIQLLILLLFIRGIRDKSKGIFQYLIIFRMSIERLYNYIFYQTTRVLNWCSNNLIVRPLIGLFKLLSVSEKRLDEVRKRHIMPNGTYNKSINLRLAFRLMLWTLTCFILTIELLVAVFLNLEKSVNWIILVLVAIALSVTINYKWLWQSNKYISHFSTFQKSQMTFWDYLFAVIVHLTITGACGLLIWCNNKL